MYKKGKKIVKTIASKILEGFIEAFGYMIKALVVI